MGILKQRKRLLAIRQIKDTMEYANKQCHARVLKLNNSNTICSCPKCKTKKYVLCTGTNNRTKKFKCVNPIHGKPVWFSTSTSCEAMRIYQQVMIENLCLLAKTNATVGGAVDYNETSKHFVEYGLEGLYEFINKEVNQPIIEIGKDEDTVAVFLDISGSGIVKNKAIILARINDQIVFKIITTSNYLSSHELIATIKKRLKVSPKTKVVFVTDGETCFVGSIQHFFPNAIHIRQFHRKSCKGIIYIHIPYKGKQYTIRCLWDMVLHEGTASKEVIRHRELKAKKKYEQKEQASTTRYSKLSKDIVVWEGTVYEPRGVRRVLNQKKRSRELAPKNRTKKNTSTPDAPVIFKGSLKEARNLPVVAYSFRILKTLFGGLYITSNNVETIFNVKSRFYPHRAMKSGKRILVCILYCYTILKHKTKQELLGFFKEKVITYNFIMQKVLYGSGLQKNKPPEPSFLDVINKAIDTCQKLIIHYCDRNKKHTSRVITPLRIKKNDYNNTTQIESFCELRDEKRTFSLERIRDAAIYNPTAICF
jgi:hypothetical protein